MSIYLSNIDGFGFDVFMFDRSAEYLQVICIKTYIYAADLEGSCVEFSNSHEGDLLCSHKSKKNPDFCDLIDFRFCTGLSVIFCILLRKSTAILEIKCALCLTCFIVKVMESSKDI